MTKKATAIALPKATLVSFDRRETAGKDGNKLERVYFLDTTSNGLTAGDKVYEIYYVAKRGKRPGSLIYGDEAIFPRTEIRERSLTAKDIRRYRAAFKRRFKKVVRTARAHRPYAKKIPKITKGTCNAYWAIVKDNLVVSKPMLPMGKSVLFSSPITISTVASRLGLKAPSVKYDVRNPGAINPKDCRNIYAKSKITLPGQATVTPVTVSAGGAPTYPVHLTLLFSTQRFKAQYPSYVAQVGVDYMFGGDHYIHLALNDPGKLVAEK